MTRCLPLLLLCLTLSSGLMAQPWSNLSLYEHEQDDWRLWEDPTMTQAGDITRLSYQGWTSLSDYLRQTRFAGDDISPLVLDVGLWIFVLPHPAIWMRNEWQRDLLRGGDLSARSNASFLWSDSEQHEIYVYGPTDAELTQFRQDSPGQYARLGSVRYEATQQLVGELSEASFFNYRVPRYRFAKAYLTLQDTLSLYRCRNSDYDLPGGEAESRQDITGHDCLHWVNALHSDAGDPHQRYVAHDDLSDDAQEYLDSAFWFSLLNFIDTQYFDEQNNDEANRLSFQPTPFGRAFGWHHLRWHEGMQVGWDLYWLQNDEQNLPAGRLSLLEYPLGSGAFNGRLAGWRQPEDLAFRSSGADNGWAIEMGYSHTVMQRLRLQGDWYYKSEGWYPGVRHLDEGVGWRLGVDVRLF